MNRVLKHLETMRRLLLRRRCDLSNLLRGIPAGVAKGGFSFRYLLNPTRPEGAFSYIPSSIFTTSSGWLEERVNIKKIRVKEFPLHAKKAILRELVSLPDTYGILTHRRGAEVQNPFRLDITREEFDKTLEEAESFILYNLPPSEERDRDRGVVEKWIPSFVEFFQLFQTTAQTAQIVEEVVYKISEIREPLWESPVTPSRNVARREELAEGAEYAVALSIGVGNFPVPLYGVQAVKFNGSGLRGRWWIGCTTTNIDWNDDKTVCTGDQPAHLTAGLSTCRGGYYGSVYNSSVTSQPSLQFWSGRAVMAIIKELYLKEG
ncbi:MAG: hypothetical protein C6I01_00595 [Epsilonproteobacteria bacterium]|nr:hypothetical protein [Campylobacterota bacterium]NPA88914.1 hypothetical protein [Campylobacterota bacterium]